MKKKINSFFFRVSFLTLYFFFNQTCFATNAIPYSGKISLNGHNFNGKANFKFSIKDSNEVVHWKNNNSEGSISVNISNGRYLVLIGGQGMNILPSTLFIENKDLSVEVEVDLLDGKGFRKLNPNQQITAVPFSLSSEIAENALLAEKAKIAEATELNSITMGMLDQEVRSMLEKMDSSLNSSVSLNNKYLSPLIVQQIFTDQKDPEFSKPIILAAKANGRNLSYQWKLNGETIEDQNSSELRISKMMPFNEGNYTLEITNDYGTSETLAFSLNLPKRELWNWSDIEYEYSDPNLNDYNYIQNVFTNENNITTILSTETYQMGIRFTQLNQFGYPIKTKYIYSSFGDDELLTDTKTLNNDHFILSTDYDQYSFGEEEGIALIKLDSQANIAWEKSFSGNGIDRSKSVLVTADSSFLIFGDSDSDIFGDKSQGHNGNRDYWLIKTDQLGNKIWDKTFGGTEQENAVQLLESPQGSFVLAGNSKSNISGNKSSTGYGFFDSWIIKLDQNGNKIWDKSFGGNADDILRSVVILENGDLIFSCDSNSSAGNDLSQDSISSDGHHVWICKINSSGDKIWDLRIGQNDNLGSCYPSLSYHDNNLHLLYSIETNTEKKTLYVKIDINGSVVKQNILDLNGTKNNFFKKPITVQESNNTIVFERGSHELIKLKNNFENPSNFSSSSFGKTSDINTLNINQSIITLNNFSEFSNTIFPRSVDFYNHSEYLLLTNPANDPVWSDPNNPSNRILTSTGRTIERYLAGWAYDGYGADPDSDPLYEATSPIIDRAFFVPKLKIKKIGPLEINHLLYDLSSSDTSISWGETYSFVDEYFDEWWFETRTNLWKQDSLTSNILGCPNGLAFTHIINEMNQTTALQLVTGINNSVNLNNIRISSSDEITNIPSVTVFSGFGDEMILELTPEYSVFPGWVSDPDGFYVADRFKLSLVNGSLESGYIYYNNIYKPVP